MVGKVRVRIAYAGRRWRKRKSAADSSLGVAVWLVILLVHVLIITGLFNLDLGGQQSILKPRALTVLSAWEAEQPASKQRSDGASALTVSRSRAAASALPTMSELDVIAPENSSHVGDPFAVASLPLEVGITEAVPQATVESDLQSVVAMVRKAYPTIRGTATFVAIVDEHGVATDVSYLSGTLDSIEGAEIARLFSGRQLSTKFPGSGAHRTTIGPINFGSG